MHRTFDPARATQLKAAESSAGSAASSHTRDAAFEQHTLKVTTCLRISRRDVQNSTNYVQLQ